MEGLPEGMRVVTSLRKACECGAPKNGPAYCLERNGQLVTYCDGCGAYAGFNAPRDSVFFAAGEDWSDREDPGPISDPDAVKNNPAFGETPATEYVRTKYGLVGEVRVGTWRDIAQHTPELFQWVIAKYGPQPDGLVKALDYVRFKKEYFAAGSPIGEGGMKEFSDLESFQCDDFRRAWDLPDACCDPCHEDNHEGHGQGPIWVSLPWGSDAFVCCALSGWSDPYITGKW